MLIIVRASMDRDFRERLCVLVLGMGVIHVYICAFILYVPLYMHGCALCILSKQIYQFIHHLSVGHYN